MKLSTNTEPIRKRSDLAAAFSKRLIVGWLAKFPSETGRRSVAILKAGSKRKEVLEKLARKYRNSFKVSNEDKFRHIRKVTPGDHKEKLAPETIKKLDFRTLQDVVM